MLYTKLQPVLDVSNLAAERDFYVALGFAVSYESDDFVGISYDEGILFGLALNPRFDRPSSSSPFTWQIGTVSVQHIEALCQSASLPIIEPPTLQSWGEWTLKVKSPNGYTVVFEGAQ